MIIVPNIHCKKTLQPKTDQPVLLLSHYIQSLLDQTPYILSSPSIIQYYLKRLSKDNIDTCMQHIAYILEHNLQESPNPNTQWIINLTKTLVSQLKEHHLIHPKSVYQTLIQYPIQLHYDQIQYHGFENISPSLQDFFDHYNITKLEATPITPTESFYQFQTISSEVQQAINFLKNNPDAAIIYLDPSYKEYLFRYQSQITPSPHTIAKQITQAQILLDASTIPHLYYKNLYPKGLSLLSHIPYQHYQHAIPIPYFSIHYPSQISSDKIPYTRFLTIIQTILKDWNMEIPRSVLALQSLDILNIQMTYQEWHDLGFQDQLGSDFTLPIYAPKDVEGAQFSKVWLLGASQHAWQHQPNLIWIPHTASQDLSYLQSIASEVIHSSQIISSDGEHLHFYKDVEIGYPDISSDISIESIRDTQAPSLEEIRASSSLIQDYVTCPFKAYARHRLKLEPKAHYSHDMEKRDYGIIIHQILEKLYRDVLEQSDLESIDETHIHQLILKAWKPYKLHPDLTRILQQRMHQSILQWIEKDLSRDDFTIEALEQKSTLAIGHYTLNLRIDRIDKSNNQSIMVDYKTGHIHINESLSPYFTNPQMLFYALTQDHAPQIAYAKPLYKQAIYQSIDLSQLDDYESLSQSWIDQSYQALVQYQKGYYPIRPVHTKVCEHCDFKALCRYAFGDSHAG